MTIICISRGSNSRGEEVATLVAQRLGYECIGRDLLLAASEEFDIPELKLSAAIEQPPSSFDRIRGGRQRYVAYIRSALLERLRSDDVVYHGLAGHFFLRGISHVLKVRILATLEDRVAIGVARKGISEAEARQRIARTDKARKQWGLQLYGFDPEDPALYDVVVHVGTMGTDSAVDIICALATQEAFKSTPESRQALEDLALAASVEAALVEEQPDLPRVRVTCHDGEVKVALSAPPRVRGGTDPAFRDHFVADLRHRLYRRSRGLAGLTGLDVTIDD